jgi:hypothetical protein
MRTWSKDAHSRARWRSSVWVWALPLAALVVGLVGTAQAAPSTKKYQVTIAPATAAAGSTANYTLTLTNDSTSSQNLGSANVSVATGFTVNSVGTPTAPGGKSWSATPNASIIELRAATQSDSLAPGQSVSTSMSVTTACNANSAQTWSTVAKQANNFSGSGNDFKSLGDPALTVTQGGGTAARLVFVQQPPATAEKNSPFTVSVKAVDSCGFDTTSSQNASLAFGNNPGGATALSLTPQSLSSGTATFSGVTVDKSGVGYTLVASATGFQSATSNAFDVVDVLCVSSDPVCEATDDSGTTKVKTPAPPPGGTMAFTFSGLGTSFECGDGTLQTIGAQTTIDPDYPSGAAPIDVTLTWIGIVPQGGGVSHFTFCLSKDDGLSYTEVPECNKRATNLPCERSRNAAGVANLELVVRIAPDDPIGAIG